jgi:transposase
MFWMMLLWIMKRDGRKLDHKTLEEMRILAVKRMQDGEPPEEVASSLGLHRTWAYKIRAQARGRGKGLRALRSTKGTGRPRKLTAGQERQVFRWINGKNPMQHQLEGMLWSRAIVRALIQREWSVCLSLASVGALLARLGLTPRKPLQRAYRRDPEAIGRWQRETYLAIAQEARETQADVYFWDESGFRADALQGKTKGVKGQTPVVQVPGQRQSIGSVSAVSAKGEFWFSTYVGGLTGEMFLGFLKQLMRRRKKPLHLVLDNLSAHKTAAVQDYVSCTNGKLTLHFLPGYAPEPGTEPG